MKQRIKSLVIGLCVIFCGFLALFFLTPVLIAVALGLDVPSIDPWLRVQVAAALTVFLCFAAVLSELDRKLSRREGKAWRRR